MQGLPDSSFTPKHTFSLPGLGIGAGEHCGGHTREVEGLHGPNTSHVLAVRLDPQTALNRGHHIFDGKAGPYGDLGRIMFGPRGSSLHVRARGNPTVGVVYCSFDSSQFNPA